MATEEKNQQNESAERQKDSHGTEKYGSGPGSSGPGRCAFADARSQSYAGKSRGRDEDVSADRCTEGPSTNLADPRTGRSGSGDAGSEQKVSEDTIKKPSAKKREAA